MRALKELLTTPAPDLGRAGRLLVRQYRLWLHCFRLLGKNRVEQLAASLSYYTIFGIVPLAIAVVLIFHSIPAYRQMGEEIKGILYEEMRLTSIQYPDPDDPEKHIVLTDYLDGIINRFFAGVDKGSLGVVSAVLLVWAALRLLSIIEGAFNHMWHVPRGRRFLHRVINYWALLTLVPLLLGAALYMTTKYSILQSIRTGVPTVVGPVISYLASAAILFVLYLIMPNAKVQAGPAAKGAVIAALVWSVARWGFTAYVTELIPYSAIYGVLGLIPLGIFWVYVTWVIVLFGLQLTFTVQHFDTLETAEIPQGEEVEGRFIANDMTAVAVAREVAAAFEGNRGPISTDDVCRRLDIPGEFGQRLLDELAARGVLAKTAEPRRGFVPARDPSHIRLSEIADAMAAASFGQPKSGEKALQQVAAAQRQLLAQYNLRQLIDASAPQVDGSPQGREGPTTREPTPDAPTGESLV
ncbi:MAG: YihY family inner membrane protein [Sedimentisphaerales bacterium]|nr:YihY family inner membrane protein [Sedimentisphaerales bacterium]